MAAIGANARATFDSLSIRNYRCFFLGQMVSIIGNWMQVVAQAWLVLSITDSSAILGLTITVQFLPTLLLGPYAGVVADRVDKRSIVIGTESVALMCALVLGVLAVTGRAELWMVLVLAAILGTCSAFQAPARQTFVLETVGPDKLTNAVGLMNTAMNVGRLLGPALAGAFISLWGLPVCFFANVASFVISISAVLLVRRSDLRPTPRVPRAKGQLREGLRAVRADPALKVPLLMMLVVGTFTLEFIVTLPVMARDGFDVGAGGYGLMQSAMSIGAIGGGLYVANRVRPSHRWLVGAAFGLGLWTGVLALSPSYGMALVVLVPLGVGNVMFSTLANATLQLAAAPEMRSRVMALFGVAWVGTTPIGGALLGWVAQVTHPRVALGIGSIAAIGTALVAWPILSRTRDPGTDAADNEMMVPLTDDETLDEMVPRSDLRSP